MDCLNLPRDLKFSKTWSCRCWLALLFSIPPTFFSFSVETLALFIFLFASAAVCCEVLCAALCAVGKLQPAVLRARDVINMKIPQSVYEGRADSARAETHSAGTPTTLSSRLYRHTKLALPSQLRRPQKSPVRNGRESLPPPDVEMLWSRASSSSSSSSIFYSPISGSSLDSLMGKGGNSSRRSG